MSRRIGIQTDILASQKLAEADIEYHSELQRLLEHEVIAILADPPRFGSVGFTITFHAGRAARLDRNRTLTTKAASNE